MPLSRKPWRTVVGLLSLSAQASAVALSDFIPRATNLPAQCNTIYSQAITGCIFDDFQKAVCSKACLAGLVEINALVVNNCQAADVAETSIIGLFKLGKAIQVLCNVAVVTTTTGLRAGTSTTIALMPMPMPMPTSESILSTHTTMLSTTKATTTSTSSSSAISSATPSPSTKQSTTLSTTQPASTPSTSSTISTPPPPTAATTSQAKSTSASKTSISPAEAESIRSGNTNSGGGSPFDNINNSGAASIRTIAQLGSVLLASLALGSYLALA